MSSVKDKTEFLLRWNGLLSKIESYSTVPNSLVRWQQQLHAKVLRYLINRYQDERCWNRHALKLPKKSTSGSASMRRISDNTPMAEIQPRLPTSDQQLRAMLDHIQQANIESYKHFAVHVD